MQALGKQCNNMLNSKDSNQKRKFITKTSNNKYLLPSLIFAIIVVLFIKYQPLSKDVYTITLSNGDIYKGEISNNLPNGEGTYTFTNGDIYVGEFIDGVIQGKGKYIWASSKDEYEGDFVNGLMDGKGKYRATYEAFIYEGDFKNDLASGTGIFIFDYGDKYEGEVLNWMFHGNGKYTYSNGEIKEGKWIKDEFIE